MKSQYGVDSMPETAENVAQDYRSAARIRTRSRFAVSSARESARESSFFDREIAPVTIPQKKGDPVCLRSRRTSARVTPRSKRSRS